MRDFKIKALPFDIWSLAFFQKSVSDCTRTIILLTSHWWTVFNNPAYSILLIAQKFKLVLLPSTHRKTQGGWFKYSDLGVRYSRTFTNENSFWKWTITDRKGHRCAEVVHYGSGIIAFFHISSYCNEIVAVPDTEWQITPGSIAQVWGWWRLGSIGFCLKSVALPSLYINRLYHFQSF